LRRIRATQRTYLRSKDTESTHHSTNKVRAVRSAVRSSHRMPRSLAGDLTDPEMAQPYMKKDDDDSDS
jgi:hypothetical protein